MEKNRWRAEHTENVASATGLIAFILFILAGIVGEVVDREYEGEFKRRVHERSVAAEAAEWRNAFWERVALPPSGLESQDQRPLLAQRVRELFLSPEGVRLDPATWNEIAGDLKKEGTPGPSRGVFSDGWILTEESSRRIECIRAGAECEPEEIPPEIDPPSRERLDLAHFLSCFLVPWLIGTGFVYAFCRVKLEADAMLGITDRSAGLGWRLILMATYAPVLLTVLAYQLLARGLAATVAGAMRVRVRIDDARSPYRKEIREAKRAVTLLEAADAPQESVAGALEVLEQFRKRRQLELRTSETEAEARARAARLREANDALLRLSAELKTLDQFPNP